MEKDTRVELTEERVREIVREEMQRWNLRQVEAMKGTIPASILKTRRKSPDES